MADKRIPAVSIIVPMYNVEKFIGECLDSILAQTFTDYELLVVDDCSTDKSVEIVESYIPKFGGRLQLIKSEKNSGGRPGTPRNIAIDIAHGEYIMFVDSDDAIMPTALEELYPVAKKFTPDLLLCQKFFEVLGDVIPKDGTPIEIISEGWTEAELVEKPVSALKNLSDRAEAVGFKKCYLVPWNRLFRREFVIQNNIKFPNFRTGSDFFFDFFAMCLAKNIVLAPNIFYIWRKRGNSVSRGDLPPKKLIEKWTETTFYGMPLLDKFMNRFDLFRANKEYHYLIFEAIVYHHLRAIFPVYENIPDVKLGGFMPVALADEIVRPLLDKVEDKTTLLTVFFNRMNFFQVRSAKFHVQAIEQQKQIEELQEQIKKLKEVAP